MNLPKNSFLDAEDVCIGFRGGGVPVQFKVDYIYIYVYMYIQMFIYVYLHKDINIYMYRLT
jgi:hypothetical protein